jgi:hypothetical protein
MLGHKLLRHNRKHLNLIHFAILDHRSGIYIQADSYWCCSHHVSTQRGSNLCKKINNAPFSPAFAFLDFTKKERPYLIYPAKTKHFIARVKTFYTIFYYALFNFL